MERQRTIKQSVTFSRHACCGPIPLIPQQVIKNPGIKNVIIQENIFHADRRVDEFELSGIDFVVEGAR